MQNLTVRIVKRRGMAVVVEHVNGDDYRRVSVSESVLTASDAEFARISVDDFEMGIPYGLPFSEVLQTFCIEPLEIERDLHKLGIWTAEDIRKNPRLIQSAILSCCSRMIADISNSAVNSDKE